MKNQDWYAEALKRHQQREHHETMGAYVACFCEWDMKKKLYALAEERKCTVSHLLREMMREFMYPKTKA